MPFYEEILVFNSPLNPPRGKLIGILFFWKYYLMTENKKRLFLFEKQPLFMN
jgi:hypothetical protein